MLIVGELTMERAQLALDGELADIVYSDPPWGPGNLMYWRTHNRETARPSWGDFLLNYCRVVAGSIVPGAHVMVEMGVRWVDELAAEMKRNGIRETKRWNCMYGNPRLPNVLWYSGPGCSTDPSGLSGVRMTTTALSGVVRAGALVFDPCCGKGMTARCATRLGMRFAGVELNPRRAEVTQRWLDKNQSRKTS